MRILKVLGQIGIGLLLLVVGAAVWAWLLLWARPVGVTNYVNKHTFKLATDSPELLTSIGAIDDTPLDFHSGKLASYTKAQEEISLAKARAAREGLDRYCDASAMASVADQTALTCRITAFFMDDVLANADFDYSGYPINQLSGPHINLPSFLTDQHKFGSPRSVERYLSRLDAFGRVLEETATNVASARDAGVVAPDFILEKTLIGLRAFADTPPAENPLVVTLAEKLKDIDMDDAAKTAAIAQAQERVRDRIYPGYQTLIAQHEALLETADSDAGIWRIPNGEQIYANALRSNTTTDMSADNIHRTGLAEVARIEAAMEAILVGEGLVEGSISARIQSLMSDPEHQFPNTDAGRAEMIAYLDALNDQAMARAPEFFQTIPPQAVEIVRVPEFSQDSAPGGYYQQAALDGSRPGRFYINLKDTADNPRWTLPTLLYHEAAPGHHFQISRAQLITGVPFIRKFSPFSAYNEGWALYAEYLAAEDMDMYANDPLGDLGRLQAEMFRAVRLVVDTGLHDKRWSRERAIAYMVDKTGMTEAEVTREIERYVVWPGQATAYKTGQLAILDMRADAQDRLGDAFDLRAFNEALLENGSMPLGILAEVMADWTDRQVTGSAPAPATVSR